jgi:hypothetical protein
MTQPRFAPITEDGEVRPAYRLAPPRPWLPHRVAELVPGERLVARAGGGVPGPDQGYALRLANRLAPRLVLTPGEHSEDVLAAAVAIGLVRASIFGRAPVSSDLELALGALGYLGEASPELVAARRSVVDGAAHDYLVQRHVARVLPDAMLRSTPDQVAGETTAVLEHLTRLAAGVASIDPARAD